MTKPNTNVKFEIRLKEAHEATGLTYYKVGKETGLAANTVQKYAEHEKIVSVVIPTVVVVLADFYGIDWRDEKYIRVIEVSEDEESPEIKTPPTQMSKAA